MTRVILPALLLGALACSSAPPQPPDASSFPAEPYASIAGNAGKVHIELRASPQPLAVGNDDLQLAITDASGAPLDGLSLTVKPFMPADGHGTSETTVAAAGDGKYLVTNVYLFMSGVWQLQISVFGPTSDYATTEVELP
jgi:hypothetical protein